MVPPLEDGEFRIPQEAWDFLLQADLTELTNAPHATMRFVPRRARVLYSECFAFAASEAVREGKRGLGRGFRLTLVVSAMLLMVARGGSESANVAVLRRCEQFRRGDWAPLLWWTVPGMRPSPFGGGRVPRTEEEERARIRREVQRLMEDGQVGKATDRLMPVPMAPSTVETLGKLESLCPPHGPEVPESEA